MVLEVVRAAIVAYGTPQEVLTGNGSQYVTWRGTSPCTEKRACGSVRRDAPPSSKRRVSF